MGGPRRLKSVKAAGDQLLTVAEVAKELRLCAATVYRLCERGELRHVRILNSIRVRAGDLDELLGRR
ncbi:MAG: DNA-binding protein [Myxococcales bacterium]|nr:DNA-binding protein [Myxococcales bacterium]